ncbi:hypothetical protein MYAM1_003694 [Malassezia yamatoensis]|uniref:NADP-dependent oxidoreductase domain-containing protein n=1 Tax=Malassezia yamatoensis TaxID=253288 RepID=A0AAJ5YW92_9BASI|nr:hypothetical protein MYAM1_003694 [Malassezia yamatoensis]
MEYISLGKSGLKISRIVLGCMSYGTSQWADWVLDEEESLHMLKYAYDRGITTWDTADSYSMGKSEEIIGAALRKWDLPRDRVVIMTKCYYGLPEDETYPRIQDMFYNEGPLVNRVGLSYKKILDAVEASVKRLGTYIDVLQIHRLDRETPKEEIMRALNDVIEKGWVRYIGASSMAAWEFQQLQYTAEKHGWFKFVSMQNLYNLLYREEEREMIPYCRATGVGILPWFALAAGALTRPWNSPNTTRSSIDEFGQFIVHANLTSEDQEIVNRVEIIAKQKHRSMAQIAIAWLLHKEGVAPLLGLSTPQRLDQAVDALSIKLDHDELAYLEQPYRAKAVIGY